jgi:nucleoside-diphosphate kinase
MSNQKTLSIIKPDAVKAGHVDAINLMIENSGLKILEKKEIKLSKEEAQQFYAVHSDKPFYNELCEFMTSGPIIVQMIEGENAIELYRKVMGATNPSEADENTIRKKFATSIQENAVHGSDSEGNALEELNFFFKDILKS